MDGEGRAAQPGPWARYGEAVRQAIRDAGLSQRQLARRVHTSETNLSEILAGHRPPSQEIAARIGAELGAAGSGLHALYERARGAPRPVASTVAVGRAVPARGALPAELVGLLQMMRQVTDKLPYNLRGPNWVSLSSVYVRQSVAAPAEMRRLVREDGRLRDDERLRDDDAEDAVWVEEQQRASGLAQPFEEVVDQHDHLVIEGAAGLGKTTLGHHLVGGLAEALLDPGIPSPLSRLHVPLVVPARALASHVRASRSETLRVSVTSEYGMLAHGEVPAWLFEGAVAGMPWLVVVDALDEIPGRADRERLLMALAAWMSPSDSPLRFVVTTRPLSAGETARLHGGRVGFYELQPFDREALISFAQRWFDPDAKPLGALAAAEFLAQIRAAGLEEIVEVPLLATVAAQVHESSRGRPLPASRYELYQEYIDQFAQARPKAGAALQVALAGVPGGVELAGWLVEHRVELLEKLATAYTASETPLLQVARDVLAEAAPRPERLPNGWEDTFVDWLSQTGLLGRRGTRLRFLHQTFAEHLTATARAKTIPAAFDPDDPLWAELVSGCLLEDETAQRVLLHYLHQRGPGSGVLDWLQHGSNAAREAAGRLITQGAPVDEEHFDTHLTRVEERSSPVGGWTKKYGRWPS